MTGDAELVRHRASECLPAGEAWRLALLVDVGSTFTKATVITPGGEVAATARATTTIDTDVLEGLERALDELPSGMRPPFDWALCCSSAAGGLRIASVGLTEALSGKAGVLAALGAGGKVVATENGYLGDDALARLAAARPHLVILAGGVDGGNADALVHNAGRLADLDVAGVIVAGNRDAAAEAGRALSRAGRVVRIVGNVFPAPGEVAIEETREAVRDLFLQHITKAKGLEGLMARLGTDCEPTPLAVSRALWGLPHGGGSSVVLVDLGGATTDVHSAGGLQHRLRNVDLPVPDVTRTVEGDLGMRWGAPGVVDAMSEEWRAAGERAHDVDLAEEAARRQREPSFVPATAVDFAVDRHLAQAAVATAVERHAGRVVIRRQPWGERHRTQGKDLRHCRLLIATGGAMQHQPDAAGMVAEALAGSASDALLPRRPEIRVDDRYAMYAAGLVARHDHPLSQLVVVALLGADVCPPR